MVDGYWACLGRGADVDDHSDDDDRVIKGMTCPHCGEERLVELIAPGTWACGVCAKTWGGARGPATNGPATPLR